MNTSVIIASLLILVQSINSVPIHDPQFEIRDGNCSRAVASDLVFQKHIHLSRIPFTKREDTESWYGDYKIYCIMAISEKPAVKGSTVNITEGGLDHTFISLKLASSSGHGLEYLINIYANTTRKTF